ncbi:MAG TPA: thioredoxin domain-containing protein [Candidatus Angelobacter sp.]|nr:thioredoxin domain-containing protein [Candidatus Angelobacter sp.]
MTKAKISAFFISFSIAFTLAGAQTGVTRKPSGTARTTAHPAAASPTALPTTAEVDAYMKRSFGYDPGVSWQVLEIRESDVPGIAEIMVSVNKGDPYHLFYSSSAQRAFVGQVIPFGPNPYASNRTKLQAAFGPSKGGATSAIQIVEFSDLECPHCKAAQPVVEKLQADFPQVRFVFQQFPLPASLHPWAMKAALYADCAGQMNKENFWKYVDSIFESQGGIAMATVDDKLKELATAAGYDGQKISTCAASPEAEARVKKSLDLGQTLNVSQTPTVFINGRAVLGLGGIPYDNLKNLVQFEIEHAGK